MFVFKAKTLALYKSTEYIGIIFYYLSLIRAVTFVIEIYLAMVGELTGYSGMLLYENPFYAEAAKYLLEAAASIRFSLDIELEFNKNYIGKFILAPGGMWLTLTFHFLMFSAIIDEYFSRKGYDTTVVFEPEIISYLQQDDIGALINKYKHELADNAKIQIKSIFYRTPQRFSLYYLANQANAHKTKNVIKAFQMQLDPVFIAIQTLADRKHLPTDIITHVLDFLTIEDLMEMYNINNSWYIFNSFAINIPGRICMKKLLTTEILHRYNDKELKQHYLSFLQYSEDKKTYTNNIPTEIPRFPNDPDTIRLSYLV